MYPSRVARKHMLRRIIMLKNLSKKTIRSFTYLAIRTRVGILHAQSSRFALARRMRDQELAHANAKTPRPDGPG